MSPLCSESLGLLGETAQLVSYLPQKRENLSLIFTFQAQHSSELGNPSTAEVGLGSDHLPMTQVTG